MKHGVKPHETFLQILLVIESKPHLLSQILAPAVILARNFNKKRIMNDFPKGFPSCLSARSFLRGPESSS